MYGTEAEDHGYINDISFHDSASSVNIDLSEDGLLSKHKNRKSKKNRRHEESSGFLNIINNFIHSSYEAICIPKTISIGDYRKSDSSPTSIKSKPIIGISSTASSLNIDNFRAALLQETVSAEEVEKIFNDTRSHLFVNIGGNTLLNPRSTFMLYWQTLNLLLTVISLLFVPVEVAFTREEMGYWFLILGASFEFFFTLDLIINLNLPVQDKASGLYLYNIIILITYK